MSKLVYLWESILLLMQESENGTTTPGENPGDAQQQPEIILSPAPSPAAPSPAPAASRICPIAVPLILRIRFIVTNAA